LFRAVGLAPDGPVRWGSPVRAPGPGVYIVEWPVLPERAPIDISAVGTWLARVPTLRLDGERPTGKALAARLAAFWLPGEPVVYVGSTPRSLRRRMEDMLRTPLGDARPQPAGAWLKTLAGVEAARVWWVPTTAAEEYEDALLAAFAEGIPPLVRARLHDPAVVLPFANLRTGTGERKAHGLSGMTVEPAAAEAPAAEATSPATAERAGGRAPARGTAPDSISPATLERLNDLLQAMACGEPGQEITPAQANAQLPIRVLLGEKPGRPAAALGQLLRAGLVEGSHRDLDGRWTIRCTRRGG
jgi:hypothetical protein